MRKINFLGTKETEKELQKILNELDQDIQNIAFYEINSLGDLNSFAQYIANPKLTLSVFIILGSQNKEILSKLPQYKISGFFLKPLDAKIIKGKLEAFKEAIVPDELLSVKIIARAETMPAMPLFVQKIVKNADNGEMNELIGLIKQDQVLASNVVRMANSPFYGVRQSLTNIDRCVVLLGFDTIKNIALAASVNTFYNKNFQYYGTTAQEMWTHAYKVGLISEILAKKMKRNAEVAFLSGLLHDIGKVVLVDFITEPVLDIADEERLTETNHAEVAEIVLKRWYFSEAIIHVIRFHHEKPIDVSNDFDRITILVYFANIIMREHEAKKLNLLREETMLLIDSIIDELGIPDKENVIEQIKYVLTLPAQ